MTNPFFEDWTAPFEAPPLDRFRPEHFLPAYDRALAEHTAEIVAIAENPAPPSFENVVVALEKSGHLLTRVDGVFSNLTSSATNDALQAIELEMAPRLSAHWSAISMHPVLFRRLDALQSFGPLRKGRDSLTSFRTRRRQPQGCECQKQLATF